MAHKVRRWPTIAALAVGIGMAVAPAAFQMFSRAPLGETMINDFRPYMTAEKIDNFRGYMTTIDAASKEAVDLRERMIADGTVTAADYDRTYSGVATLNSTWQGINADMSDLLDRMDVNRDNYAAVDALPRFGLFPWFFVAPGLMVAGVAAGALLAGRKGRSTRKPLWALAGLGVAIIAAPVAFQMFSRAPLGGDMINDFRPMMTHQRVQNVQRYFITLGSGEGQLRVGVVPAYTAAGGSTADLPALTEFSTEWPTIVHEFNPMIATMGDNVDNFQAVDALPPFALFPWFFVIPGVLVACFAGLALRRHPSPNQPTGG